MFFVVDSDREVSPQQAALVWHRLWELRDITPVNALLPAGVVSSCPLLPDETADSVYLPTMSLVPGDSAWISFELDLMRFACARGDLRMIELEARLRECVDAGEQRHDEAEWANSAMSHDSAMNRRLSVFVRGWGDLVRRRGEDPVCLPVLGELEQLARHIESVLVDASRTIATRDGYCPAIDAAGVRVQRHGREMATRWQRAVRANAMRHRNLLTLSPWDVFPRYDEANARYMNLLPVIRCANSVSFRRDVRISHWGVAEFRSFHERVGAILRRSGNGSLVAKRV
ncbi:MAG: hypothetical protein QNJ11_18380 [Woeseiaceae bacterium]|nr:hypothetical protein [Woeseiaceae bacterium]